MERCAICDKPIQEDEPSLYLETDAEFGQTVHSQCHVDIVAARRALADFQARGGTTLEEFIRELGLED